MLGKVTVQAIAGLLLLGAATMFVNGAQAGAFRQAPQHAAPIVAAADTTQSGQLDLF